VVTAKVIEAFLPVEPESAREARGLVEKLRGHILEATGEDLKLLISELVTNSIRHGGLHPSQKLVVKIIARQDVVRGEITDPGGGFIHASKSFDGERTNGWGLKVVESLSSRWGVMKDPPTRVWFEIDVKA